MYCLQPIANSRFSILWLHNYFLKEICYNNNWLRKFMYFLSIIFKRIIHNRKGSRYNLIWNKRWSWWRWIGLKWKTTGKIIDTLFWWKSSRLKYLSYKLCNWLLIQKLYFYSWLRKKLNIHLRKFIKELKKRGKFNIDSERIPIKNR